MRPFTSVVPEESSFIAQERNPFPDHAEDWGWEWSDGALNGRVGVDWFVVRGAGSRL
jgi:hypothetical protein